MAVGGANMAGLHKQLNLLYKPCSCCGGLQLDASNTPLPKFNGIPAHLNKAFKRAARFIHTKGGFTPDMLREKPVKDLTDALYFELSAGIDYGIADNEIPEKILQSLKNDVFVFSGCKTYAELKEVSSLLIDDSGNAKPFYQFSRDVQALHENYNLNYLESEYQFAVDSAQMAAKWVDFERNSSRYSLQYRTAGDDRVRASHAILNRITLPAADAFWLEYFPPNGWRCRCNVVQVRAGKYPVSNSNTAIQAGKEATTQISQTGENSAQMFRFNPGKQKVIFPPHHPYYKVKTTVSQVLNGLQTDKVNLLNERENEYNELKTDNSFLNVLFNKDTGGLMATHTEHSFDPLRGKNEKIVQNILYRNGNKTILGAEKGLYKVKTPDGILNGLKMDIKTIEGTTDNTIKNALNAAKKQGAEHVVLYFPNAETFNSENLSKAYARYIGATKNNPIKKVWYVVNGKVYLFK